MEYYYSRTDEKRPYNENSDSFKSWVEDFLRYRREILYRKVPELEPAVPFILANQSVFVLFSPNTGTLTMRYYRSKADRDIVQVKEIAQYRPHDDEMSEEFTLPPRTELLNETKAFSRAMKERQYNEWGHPYFAAANDLMQHIRRYNNSVPEAYLDATYLTEAKLRHWTVSYIDTVRELSERFPEVAEYFETFRKGVVAIHFYSLDEPRNGWIRDGVISSHYVQTEVDRIETVRLENRAEIRNVDEILKSKFGFSPKDAFLSTSSSILYYLREKLDAG